MSEIERYQRGIDGRYHFVYAVINTLNGKYYYGRHSTYEIRDNYFGSGTIITKAIKKYGKQYFIRRDMAFYDTMDEAKEYEQELLDNVLSKPNNMCYNVSRSSSGGKISTDISGYRRTELDKKRKSEISLKNKSMGIHPSYIRLKCPYCNKESDIGNAKRWHFENCRKK